MRLLAGVDNWNVTATERAAGYPAHRYATGEYRTLLRGIDVAAPPAIVYRWLCQLTLAPYSYDWLDNLGRRSPRELVPGADRLRVGQSVIVGRITEFEPDRQLTAAAVPAARRLFGLLSLTYQITGQPGGARLVVCLDVRADSWFQRARVTPLALGDLVMMRKQLRTFKTLAERGWRAEHADPADPRGAAGGGGA